MNTSPSENQTEWEQGQEPALPADVENGHPYSTHQISRRTILKGGAAAGVVVAALFALHELGVPGMKNMIVSRLKDEGFNPEAGEEATEEEYFSEAEHIIHKYGIGGINAIGFLSFVDAVTAIGLKKDSYVQKICVALGIPTYNTGEMEKDDHGHEKSKFPIENAYLAMVLHALRIATDHHAGEHSISELKTTVIGVGMLGFFTSFAKGMNSISGETDAMVEIDGMMLLKEPNKVLSKTIFQLTMLASVTQFPLFAFGNASIGNEQFPQVQNAFRTMYTSVLPRGNNLPRVQNFGKDLMSLPKTKDGVDKELVLQLIGKHKSDFPQIYDVIIEKLVAKTDTWYSEDILQMIMDSRTSYIRNVVLERAGKLENKEVGARIKNVIESNTGHIGWGDIRDALDAESVKHSNDLMVLLMATACDDTQAAVGDLGPLVGLFQAFGWQAAGAIIAILPYTITIGAERAMWACKRSGVPLDSVFNAPNFKYMKEFWKTAISNLGRHFISKFSRHVDANSDSNVGVQYSVLGQMLEDAQAGFSILDDARLGSFNEDTLNFAKIKDAIKIMKAGQAKYSQELGDQVREKARKRGNGDENIRVRVSGMGDIREEIIGKRSDDPELRDMQDRLNKLSLDLTDEQIKSKTPEIQEFLAHLKSLESTFYDEMKVALDELKKLEGGNTPSIQSIAALLQKNPKINDLLDFNYWHDRLGPELTDTIFVVTLQGLHLPFIIETIQVIYDHPSFKAMPMWCRNWFSAALNNGISSVADNWADSIAHAYWLKKMYFDEAHKFIDGVPEDHGDFDTYGIGLAGEYPEIKSKLNNGFFKIENSADKNITEQFEERKQQIAALIEYLIQEHPEDKEKLSALRITIMDKLEELYWRSMIMALLTAVTGGGKLLTGNAPHFTYAADIEEFDFKATLSDLTNHPLYHIWEFCFSTSYSTIVGPALANSFFGTKAVKQIKKMMQKKFKDDYPVFYKKINELKAEELVNVKERAVRAEDHGRKASEALKKAQMRPVQPPTSATPTSLPNPSTTANSLPDSVDHARRGFLTSFANVFRK